MSSDKTEELCRVREERVDPVDFTAIVGDLEACVEICHRDHRDDRSISIKVRRVVLDCYLDCLKLLVSKTTRLGRNRPILLSWLSKVAFFFPEQLFGHQRLVSADGDSDDDDSSSSDEEEEVDPEGQPVLTLSIRRMVALQKEVITAFVHAVFSEGDIVVKPENVCKPFGAGCASKFTYPAHIEKLQQVCDFGLHFSVKAYVFFSQEFIF
jgi:hypothetical protein